MRSPAPVDQRPIHVIEEEDEDLHALLDDDGDADVVAVALAALDETDQLAFDDPALLIAAAPDRPWP